MNILLDKLFSGSYRKEIVENIKSISIDKITDEDKNLGTLKKCDLHIEDLSITYKNVSVKIGYMFIGKWFWIALIFGVTAFIVSIAFDFFK